MNLKVKVNIAHKVAEENHVPGQLTFVDQPQRLPVQVHAGQRFNMATKEYVKCWHVRNNGRGLLKEKLNHYKVPSLHYRDIPNQ